VRKNLLPIVLGCLSLSLLPVFTAGSRGTVLTITNKIENVNTGSHTVEANNVNAEAIVLSLYDSLQLDKKELSFEALKYAYQGYQNLLNRGLVKKTNVLTVIDFSKSSHKKRMFIIDLDRYRLLVNTYVAHGKNTGLEYAKSFSNKMESLQSSLGFYITKGTYFGNHGLSLKLEGKERGINDKAEDRAVVIHGANYIGDHRLGFSYMGRSFGCPAVPQAEANKVINLIKNGTCLFIYHPSENYLNGSKLLNG
jgi:hypothetical protein